MEGIQPAAGPSTREPADASAPTDDFDADFEGSRPAASERTFIAAGSAEDPARCDEAAKAAAYMRRDARRRRIEANAERFAAAALAQHITVGGQIEDGQGGQLPLSVAPVYSLETADERHTLTRAGFDLAEAFELERERREAAGR